MRRKYESATAFLRRKHPVLKASLDYTFGLISKEIRTIVVTLMIGGAFTFNSCRLNRVETAHNALATVVTNAINNATEQ